MSYKISLAAVILAGMVVSPGLSQSNSSTNPTSSAVATAAGDYSKEAFVIEKLYTRIAEESDGTGLRERTAEIRILSDAGVKAFAILSFPFTSTNETVEFDYVRVRKPDGTVVKTPDYNIQDMPAEVSRIAPLYSDIHEKHVAVKGLAVGDTLEYVMRVREIKAQVPGQFWYEDSFNKTSIVRDEQLEITVPKDKYVKISSPEFKPEITEENGRRIYRWKHANLEVKEKDPYEIPRRTPPNPDVQVTSFASWEDLGRWYGELQKGALAITPAIQAKATELTKGLKTDEEKIRALYEFVSLKYHYIGLDFGVGRYQPHAADDVLDNGYGDCKDKHTLLAALLKAAGYDAWPVLISATRQLDPEIPSPAQFNHVITFLQLGGQSIWLDSTPEVAPYRLLLLGLRDKQALLIPSDQPPKLITTPQNPPEPQRQDFSMEGKLDKEGTFTGHAEEVLSGDSEVLMRTIFRQLPESQWKDAIQRMSLAMNFGGDVSNVKVSPPGDLDKPLQLSWDYVRKNYSDWEERKIVAPLPPMGLEIYKGARDVKPPEPLLLGGLGKVIYRSRLQLPDGYKAEAPAPFHLKESYAEFDDSPRIENGVMITARELEIKKTEVALSDWENYRTFARSMADDESNFIALQHSGIVAGKGELAEGGTADGQANEKQEHANQADLDTLFRDGASALQGRDFQKAQELYEKLVNEDPDYKGAHFNLGVAMASRRNVTGALEQFHKEEGISPEDARSYTAAATLAAFTGNKDQAMEEWRKLLKVDPGNRTAASTLAGMLYQAGKYPEAVTILEPAVSAAPDSPGLLIQLGNCYLKTGQKEKAVATMRQAVEQKSDDPMVLNEVSYTMADNKMNLDLARQYGEKALDRLNAESQEVGSSDDTGFRLTYEFSLIWDTLGWVYFEQGDLKSAEDLVRAAWLLGEDALVAEHLGEIYEKEGKTQQAARVYEFALGVSSAGVVGALGPQTDAMKAERTRDGEITARYQKLTGHRPSMEIRRLPNGEWTQTPAEQLRHTREVKLANENKLSGSAEFIVALKPGKVESARHNSGDDALKPLSAKLVAAHYPLEFPPNSPATLFMRVEVSCHPTDPCVGTLVSPLPMRAQFSGLSTY